MRSDVVMFALFVPGASVIHWPEGPRRRETGDSGPDQGALEPEQYQDK